jgi:cysteine desulfurase
MKEKLESKSQSNNSIYMDNAASTPVDSEVVKDMMPYLFEYYGNPSSLHSMGRRATLAISKSRMRIAKLINADPSEIYFTSGGTESNNLAIIGLAKKIRKNKPKCNRLLTSEIEHDSILETVKYIQNELGFVIDYVPSTNDGFIDLVTFKEMITTETGIATIMLVNNEIGTIQPLKELVNHAKNVNKEIIFHSDSVQALGKIPIDVKELGIDMISLSSHKINGPKGIGALYLKKKIVIEPIIYGGGQEVKLRSGTENVASIVGFGKACELYRENIGSYISHLRHLQNYFIERIDKEIPGSKINGSLENRIPNNLNFSFNGINGEDLLIKLDELGLKVSTGSACSSNKKKKASHVLESIGLSYGEISSSIRFSLGIQNSKDEIDTAVDILKRAILDIQISK